MKSIKMSLFASFCAVLVLAAALLSGCENVGGRQNNLFSIDEKSDPSEVTDNSGLPDGQENSSDEDGDKPHESISDVMHESDIENNVVVSEEQCKYGSSEIISKTEYVYNQDGNKIQTIVYSVGSNGGLYLSSHQNTYYFDGEFSNVVKRTEKYTYDENGNVIGTDYVNREINGNGKTTHISSLMTKEPDYEYYIEQDYFYDENGNCIKSESDSNGTNGVTENTYVEKDGMFLKTESTYTSYSITTTSSRHFYEYDSNGNETVDFLQSYINLLQRYEDFSKTVTEYDENGSRTSRTEYNASFGDYVFQQEGQEPDWIKENYYEWTYDEHGRLATYYTDVKTDPKGKTLTTYVYDNLESATKLIKPYEVEYTSDNSAAENLSWSLENGVLTISGSGDMVKADGENLQWDEKWPWADEMPNVRKIIVESGITSIGDYAFDNSEFNNEILEEVSLPEGITYIGTCAFAYTTLKSITLPNSVKTISDSAFSFSAVETINLPDSLEYIGDSAFRCSYITSLSVPDGVKYIGEYCFQGCGGLTEIEFKGTVDAIGVLSFQETSISNISLPSGLELLEPLFSCTDIESVVIPDGVTTIPNDFIVDCESFKSITIPASVTSIGKSAFGISEYNGEDFVTIPINTFTIHAPAGSYAEKYAKENNIPFEAE